MYHVLTKGGTGPEAEAEWFGIRKSGLTATDIARLDTGGASTMAAIKAEKAGHERRFSTRATEWGKEREPILAGFAFEEFDLDHNTLVLAQADNLANLATPDLLGQEDVGDIKTTVHDWENDWQNVPRRYVSQLRWQRIVTDARKVHLIYEPHHNFRPLHPYPLHMELPYDPAEEARLLELAEDFRRWEGEGDEDAADLDAMLREALEVEEMYEDAARDRVAIRTRIEDHLGGMPRKFVGSVGNITRSADGTSTTFDSALFKRKEPAKYEQYLKTGRRKGSLRITFGTKDQEQDA